MYLTLFAPLFLIGQLSAAPAPSGAAALPEGRCPHCGAEVSAIARTLTRLESSPYNLVRFRAVLVVRRYNIACHREIVPALITALRHDRDDAVRAEAAISLSRLGASGPAVVEALRYAAAHDELSVRMRANWALYFITRRARDGAAGQ